MAVISKVKCVNRECQKYGVSKSVARGGILHDELTRLRCVACNGRMVSSQLMVKGGRLTPKSKIRPR